MLSTPLPRIVNLIADRYPTTFGIVTAAVAAMERKATQARLATASTTDMKAATKKGPQILYPTSPRVSELSGYGPAASWALELMHDVGDYKARRIEWEDVDDGVVLAGPPGTGTTIFASAIAATCGLPFIPSAFAHW